MKLSKVVEWEAEVLPNWRKAATNSSHSNSDIWGRLPPGVCWVKGEIEAQDITQLYVVGSQDWHDVFGSYQLQAISACYQSNLQAVQQADFDDAYHHHTRIRRLFASLADQEQTTQRPLIPLILVTGNCGGPMVLLDGNHRALALLQLEKLVGQSCFLGLHSKMETDFLWMKRALANAPR
jgi:hypothetical protein